jgi:predicted phosphoribosyltransferase
MRFRDRVDAGQQLALEVEALALQDPVVLALPKGGVSVGQQVARQLGAPLEVFVAHDVSAPHRPGSSVGAIAEGGGEGRDERSIAQVGLTEDQWRSLVAHEQAELERRVLHYRGRRDLPPLSGRDVILVDDGLATAVTVEAALRSLRRSGAGRLILAVPACAPAAARRFRQLADRVVCVEELADLAAAGGWYENLGPTSDDDVRGILGYSTPGAEPGGPRLAGARRAPNRPGDGKATLTPAGGVAARLRHMAQHTPPERERHVDLIRAAAMSMVVVGHWLAITVTDVNGDIAGENALRYVTWAHPLTWVFQVMPLVFMIGGYANAASMEAHRRRGGDALGWVLGRYERLLRPTAVLLAVLVVAVAAARLLGVDHGLAATGAWVATVPMWFMLAYLFVLAVAPLTMAAHKRWGFAVPVVLAVIVAGVDAARMTLEQDLVGYPNHLIAWAAFHQLGYLWRDGRLPATMSAGLPMAGAGLLAAIALTGPGPYPVSMVGVPGEDLQNTSPPTMALLAVGVAQIGAALALRDWSHRWLQRDRPWRAVVAVNSVVFTLFLWHMTAAIVVAVVLYPAGVLPVVPIGSVEWMVLRIPWLLACLAVLGVLIAVFAPIELSLPGTRRGTRLGRSLRAWAAGGAVLAGLISLLGIATAGPGEHGPLGLPSWALISFAVAMVLLTYAGRRRDPAPAGDSQPAPAPPGPQRRSATR